MATPLKPLEEMTREEHYAAIDEALARARSKVTLSPNQAIVASGEAQVHASILVVKALSGA